MKFWNGNIILQLRSGACISWLLLAAAAAAAAENVLLDVIAAAFKIAFIKVGKASQRDRTAAAAGAENAFHDL